EIDNPLTRLRPTPIERIAYARKSFTGEIGKPVERRRRVAESNRVGASGMEVILGRRIFGDLAVLLADLFAQRFQIDHIEYLGHRLLLLIACEMICLECCRYE